MSFFACLFAYSFSSTFTISPNEHTVQVVVIPLFQQALVQEGAFLHILAVQLAAEEHQPRLLVIGGGLVEAGGQAGGGVLVHVPAGFAPAQAQSLAVLRAEEAQGVVLLPLHKLQCVPLGPDVNGGHILAPQLAHAAPAGGHGVVLLPVPGGDEHPVLVNQGEGVVFQLFYRDFAKRHSLPSFLKIGCLSVYASQSPFFTRQSRPVGTPMAAL